MSKTSVDNTINPKELAFLTTQGKPLVRYQSGRRYDAIAEAWSETCEVAEVRNRGFYLLRHTGINFVAKIAGAAIADLYCQHAPDSMTKAHYLNADWRGLRRASGRCAADCS